MLFIHFFPTICGYVRSPVIHKKKKKRQKKVCLYPVVPRDDSILYCSIGDASIELSSSINSKDNGGAWLLALSINSVLRN